MNFRSELVGLFSVGASGNPTVAMIEAGFRHHGLDWRYVNAEVAPDKLADSVRGALAMGWRGFHLSIPHKVAVIPLLDELGASATLIGAVNCVVVRDGRAIGENTDGQGFLTSLRRVVDPAGKRVTVLGAGGAARAIAVELALAGAASITIVNRSPERAEPVVRILREGTAARTEFRQWTDDHVVAAGTDILVNATSVGLGDGHARMAVDLSSLHAGMVVADVIVDPPDTRFLRDAAAQGCTVVDGLGMLVDQGVLAVRSWTGIDVDARPMRQALADIFAAG